RGHVHTEVVEAVAEVVLGLLRDVLEPVVPLVHAQQGRRAGRGRQGEPLVALREVPQGGMAAGRDRGSVPVGLLVLGGCAHGISSGTGPLGAVSRWCPRPRATARERIHRPGRRTSCSVTATPSTSVRSC